MGLLKQVRFDARGLVPAICQDEKTGQVLMVAYMNRTALARTLRDRKAWFYSRSRRKQWMKGEESGHVLKVQKIRLDCDGDCLLLLVRPVGPGVCHMGYRTCFFRQAGRRSWRRILRRSFDPNRAYRKPG